MGVLDKFLSIMKLDDGDDEYDEDEFFDDDEYDDDYEESDTHYEFVDWVESNFGLQKITSNKQADVITEKASASYQAKLNDFLTKFDIDNNWD